jgi:hypothetical protein
MSTLNVLTLSYKQLSSHARQIQICLAADSSVIASHGYSSDEDLDIIPSKLYIYIYIYLLHVDTTVLTAPTGASSIATSSIGGARLSISCKVYSTR